MVRVHTEAGSGVGSLPVSPPASDARREFSTDEKGCASRQSATDKGSASAGTEPRAPERQTIAPRSCLYAGINAVVVFIIICAVWITRTVISGCPPGAISSLMVIGYSSLW